MVGHTIFFLSSLPQPHFPQILMLVCVVSDLQLLVLLHILHYRKAAASLFVVSWTTRNWAYITVRSKAGDSLLAGIWWCFEVIAASFAAAAVRARHGGVCSFLLRLIMAQKVPAWCLAATDWSKDATKMLNFLFVMVPVLLGQSSVLRPRVCSFGDFVWKKLFAEHQIALAASKSKESLTVGAMHG
jgi:hypothetical protein